MDKLGSLRTAASAKTGDGVAARHAQGTMHATDSRATLSDDTMLPAEIAAVYLGLSPAELAESHKTKRTDGRVDKGAKAQGQPTTYELGALRALRNKQTVTPGLDTASKAGLLGWLTVKLPFFAELEPRVKRGRRVLIGYAWERVEPERETRFADWLSGRVRCTWLTSSEAVASLWSEEASHRAFAANGLALLEGETTAMKASIAATASMVLGSSMTTDSSST